MGLSDKFSLSCLELHLSLAFLMDNTLCFLSWLAQLVQPNAVLLFHLLEALSCLWVAFFAVTMSEIAILALAVGVSCGAILVLLCIVVAVRFCRKKRLENDIELRPRDHERTDPTVW